MKRDAMDQLEKQLRSEAQRIRGKNGFSPLLHQRIMAGLRQHGLQAAPVPTEAHRWIWRLVGPLAAAAAVALASWLILRPTPPAPPSHPVANTNRVIPDVPPIRLTQQVDPTSTALEERKYAYLDRDARRLFTFVADQLPNLPSPPQK